MHCTLTLHTDTTHLHYTLRTAHCTLQAEEPQYAGFCHLATGRCEQTVGNREAEIEATVLAARYWCTLLVLVYCTGTECTLLAARYWLYCTGSQVLGVLYR